MVRRFDRHSPVRMLWLGLASSCWYLIHQWSPTVGALWAVLNYFIVRYSYEMWVFYRTLPRDVMAGCKSAQARKALTHQIRRDATVPLLFTETAERYPDKLFMSSNEKSWNFAETRDFSNRVANHFRDMGLQPGDEVALLMENRPEFVMIWLGLSKLGVVTALVNVNLKSASLAHCINMIHSKAVIFSSSLTSTVQSALPHINDPSIKLYHLGEKSFGDANSQDLMQCIQSASTDELIHKGKSTDRLLYIFTSGTTGLPKAAIITNQRYMFCAASMFYVCGFKTSDKIYLSLPLYHNSGGTLGPGPCIVYGVSSHIAPKFSASRFWMECKMYDCTIALYIGEMIRYLLAQPSHETDTTHQIRLLYGHGARKQLWEPFRRRFQVKNIREIYGSTEGNAGLINTDNTVGAVGFLPTVCRMSKAISRAILPMHVIRVDPDSGKPVRDSRGFCIECGPHEAGELVGLITAQPLMRFEGYLDKAATQKKVYTDIFQRGEHAFATGDIVVYDHLGYVYFQDRTGDTFRWKSENVSTNEVESVIAKIIGFNDAIVYGVAVEGTEGKAGMAAIVNKENGGLNVDLEQLLNEMKETLPTYAIPLFIRFIKEVESTTTFKYKKNNLVNDGFDPKKVKDPLFFYNQGTKQYIPLDETLYKQIVAGQVRF
ncbi:hypothetical protein BIW11_04540 [Tropilaelaps mercedesae]|uniref:Very long-chain fatty acid transport protein n=1 Tax=Tropilaelaps mercedesae TaxID=418985 RepID=A0A1V9X4W1_9ACAR|nr:hypothetical protein BIW11_04540 [Tropilaelaps mercedesae]